MKVFRGSSMRGVVLAVLVLFVLFSFTLLPAAKALVPVTIYGDPNDGTVNSFPSVYPAGSWLIAGDEPNPQNYYVRGFVKFSLAGVSGTLSTAKLSLYLLLVFVDGVVTATGTLPNPGLGDLLVIHIADYATLDAGDFNSPSIGNDPGVLIGATATPNVGYVLIDVRAAMQDDINHGRSFTAFMLKMTVNTDSDGKQDTWELTSSASGPKSQTPFIDYSPSLPVGGEMLLINVFQTILPWLTLIGVLSIVTVETLILKRRKPPERS